MVSAALSRTSPTKPTIEKILSGHVASVIPGRIPGCDGMTTRHMLENYAQMSAQGIVPDSGQLKRLHPEFRGEIDRFFSAKSRSREVLD